MSFSILGDVEDSCLPQRPYEDAVAKLQKKGDTRRDSDIVNWLTINGELPGIPSGLTETAESFFNGVRTYLLPFTVLPG